MSDLARSGAVDLDQVNARLLSAALAGAPERASSPPYVPGRSPTLPPSPPQGRERVNFEEPVKQGGRPMYPIEVIDNVAATPSASLHFIRPWETVADADWAPWSHIFETQLYHWECFR